MIAITVSALALLLSLLSVLLVSNAHALAAFAIEEHERTLDAADELFTEFDERISKLEDGVNAKAYAERSYVSIGAANDNG